jgi:hypothetical protein
VKDKFEEMIYVLSLPQAEREKLNLTMPDSLARRRCAGAATSRLPCRALGEKQRGFPMMLAALIRWAYEKGYELTFGEAYRTDEQAEINALGPALRVRLADLSATQFTALADKIRNNAGGGIRNSLHGDRLAIDLNLFINGVYQRQTEAYRPLGEKWEAWAARGAGASARPMANHFSIAHEGRA